MVRRWPTPPYEVWVNTQIKVTRRRRNDPVEVALWAVAAVFALVSVTFALIAAG